MTKEQYIAMTSATRRAVSRLPGGEKILHLPTILVAVAYIAGLVTLAMRRDANIIRAILVPALCFIAVTIMRPIIGRQRPYDRFGAPSVGSYHPGKGKSMPSRHTASAAAIACAAIYAFPSVPVAAVMLMLCAIVAALRVLAGQHYISDVLAALAVSFALSAIGYMI